MFPSVSGGHLAFCPNFGQSDPQLWKFLLVPQAWTLGVELSFYALAPFIVRRWKTLDCPLCCAWIARTAGAVFGLVYDPWNYQFSPFRAGNLSAWSTLLQTVFALREQMRMIETLQNSGVVKAVFSSSDRADGDYTLATEVRSFQVDTSSGRPAADVDVFAKLINNDTSKVVASKGFSARVASASDDPAAGVAALNQALTEVLQDTSTWVSAHR